MKNMNYVVVCNPDAYKVAIAMHACNMHERYRQERLRALGEKDDQPYDADKTYKGIINQMFGHGMR